MKGFFSNLFSSRISGKRHSHAKKRDEQKAKSQGVFVKTGLASNVEKVSDASFLTAVQKAHLVKKGTVFLEEGNITMAHKIFRALKMYDGLMRVSKAYYLQGKMTDAHATAREAWAQRDVSEMKVSVSHALRMWLSFHGLSSAYEQPSKENRRAVLALYQNRR